MFSENECLFIVCFKPYHGEKSFAPSPICLLTWLYIIRIDRELQRCRYFRIWSICLSFSFKHYETFRSQEKKKALKTLVKRFKPLSIFCLHTKYVIHKYGSYSQYFVERPPNGWFRTAHMTSFFTWLTSNMTRVAQSTENRQYRQIGLVLSGSSTFY